MKPMNATMPHRLGDSPLGTSMLALGCARLGSTLTPLDRRASLRLIEEACTLGVRHFDTASIYGQGDSERYLGEALQGLRDQVWLSSKAGQVLGWKQQLMLPFKRPLRWLAARRQGVQQQVAAQRQRGVPRCFEPDHIERSLHASLRRLRTDRLDLFYLHSPEPAVLDDGALFERLERLRAQGLFGWLGVSCDDSALAWRAAAHPQADVVQFALDAEAPALLAELRAQGKSALLRGLAGGPREALDARLQQALRLPAVGGLIVGTTRVEHLRENAASFRRALAAAGSTPSSSELIRSVAT